MKTLVTGAAGFIGFHTAGQLLARGDVVVGLDNLNSYYDVSLKRARVEQLQGHERFRFEHLDLIDSPNVAKLFAHEGFDRVVHLAAQAGVRYSLVDPHSYISNNVLGTLNVLEGCRHSRVRHLVFASSSSVYGASTRMPFSEHEPASHPLSLYAASKRATELMAHSYADLFNLSVTGLRFFTVYGPWGRPDMALFLFARAILDGKPIELFNNGEHERDFTYVSDVVEGILRVLDQPAAPDPNWDSAAADPGSSRAPFRLYNIGSSRPVPLLRYIEILEECLGRRAIKTFKPLQLGDVPKTSADCSALAAAVDYRPTTPVEIGVRRFADWYCEYYGCR